jgi:hypothetical protein
VAHWYGIDGEEKEKIHQKALHLTETELIIDGKGENFQHQEHTAQPEKV